MNKVIKDGKVAVLVSSDFGAGWFSWYSNYPELLFNPQLVKLVLEEKQHLITSKLIEDILGISIYAGGARNLEVEWVPEGTEFKIDENDGAETITYRDSDDWLKA